jgi:four helix bundle protein
MKAEQSIEQPTSNVEHRSVQYANSVTESSRIEERVYDLEERLLDYATQVIRAVEKLPRTRASNHVAGQLLRSGTSPLPNHGEAESAESAADLVHKLKICLKELRETRRWLRLVMRVPLLTDTGQIEPVLEETNEIIRIFCYEHSHRREALRHEKMRPIVDHSMFDVRCSVFDVRIFSRRLRPSSRNSMRVVALRTAVPSLILSTI